MADFELDARLAADCHLVGRLGRCRLLLADVAELPWLILVPETGVTELFDLPDELRHELLGHAATLSALLRRRCGADKINVAAIGNVVRQLHLHVVGRYHDDYCWPGVVWGASGATPRSREQVATMTALLREELGDRLVAGD